MTDLGPIITIARRLLQTRDHLRHVVSRVDGDGFVEVARERKETRTDEGPGHVSATSRIVLCPSISSLACPLLLSTSTPSQAATMNEPDKEPSDAEKVSASSDSRILSP